MAEDRCSSNVHVCMHVLIYVARVGYLMRNLMASLKHELKFK